MSDDASEPGQIIRFKIGDAFPADDPLARWMTTCAMALNDLLLVNRWLAPKLTGEEDAAGYETTYLGRLAAANLFEVATFLRKSDKRFPSVDALIAGLAEEPQAAYARLVEIGDGRSGQFSEQLKHARNMAFHYQVPKPAPGEQHDPVRLALMGHAKDEEEQGITRGVIEDVPPPITGFRAIFADDITAEMSLPGETSEDYEAFLGNVAEHSLLFMVFGKAAFNAYTLTRPDGIWQLDGGINRDGKGTPS